MDQRQLAAWAGMIGPILFMVIFTLEGWLRPGYDPLGMYISELSLGPRGWIQIFNFIIFGILFLIFAHGISIEFANGKASRSGSIILKIIAISFLVSGPLVTDPVTTLPDQMSWHGILHNIFGAIVFSLSPISCFVFLRRFREDPEWKSLKWFTQVAGIITTIAVVIMSIGTKNVSAELNAFNEWVGLFQRIVIITYLSWLFIFALKLRK